MLWIFRATCLLTQVCRLTLFSLTFMVYQHVWVNMFLLCIVHFPVNQNKTSYLAANKKKKDVGNNTEKQQQTYSTNLKYIEIFEPKKLFEKSETFFKQKRFGSLSDLFFFGFLLRLDFHLILLLTHTNTNALPH